MAHCAKIQHKTYILWEKKEPEYGSEKYKFKPKEGPEEWEYQYMKGAGLENMNMVQKKFINKEELNDPSLKFYYPVNPDLVKIKIEMHWYSYYTKWIPRIIIMLLNIVLNNNDFGRSEEHILSMLV